MEPNPEDWNFDLEETLKSVVGLRSTVPPDAHSAERLGTERAGNGCVISTEGLVVTVGYLVTEAESTWLVAHDDRVIPADVVGRDTDTGFALVQALEPLGVEPLRLGRSGDIAVGERVVVAAAGGITQAEDAKVVAKQEFAGYWEYLLDEAIYTTPPHPHWAGTAMISGDGGLCGIGSLYVQQVTQNRTPMDVNMMIPIDLLPPIIDDLVRFGAVNRPSRPWIGMQAAEFGENLVVVGLTDNGPAEAADIRVGDVVVGVGATPVESLGDLFRGIWDLGHAGVQVPLNIFRNGEQIEVRIKSRDRAANYKSPKLH